MAESPNPIEGMSKDEMFLYVYEKAKEYGDPHPEVVAAQFLLESGNGTSRLFNELNNGFGLTAIKTDPNASPSEKLDKDGNPERYWKKFDSFDESIKYRVENWSLGKTGVKSKKEAAKRYREAKDPLTAMAAIQGIYAPSGDGNGAYMAAIATRLSEYGYYDGNTDVPNADVDPDYWDNRVDTSDWTWEQKEEAYSKWKKEMDDIDALDIPDNLKKTKKNQVNRRYYELGYIQKDSEGNTTSPINDVIEKKNERFEKEYADYQILKEWVQDGEVRFSKDGKKIDAIQFEGGEKLQQMMKLYPDLFNQGQNRGKLLKDGTWHISGHNQKGTNAFLQGVQELGKSVGDEDVVFANMDQLIASNTGPGGMAVPVGSTGSTLRAIGNVFRSKKKGSIKVADNDTRNKEQSIRSVSERYIEVDPQWDAEIQKKRQAQRESLKKTEEEKTAETKTDETGEPVEEEKEASFIGDDYYNFIPEMPDEGLTYDKEMYDDPLPIAELAGNAAMALIGLDEASKPIPMRDEQVSDAFRQYSHELKMLSKMGLRPEEEAHAKNMLSQAYSSGVKNIVRASGGSRNQVLSNIGRLDAQNMMAKGNLAVEDARVKNEALFKYGEAMKYINEFDARRDIANSEREYQNVMLDKEAGAQLASNSMNNFLKEVSVWQANRPGSPNHAYRSMMMKRLFGVDPLLKDNGKGDTKWTMSWREKENERLLKEKQQAESDQKVWNSFDDTQKAFVDVFNKRTGYQFDSEILGHVRNNQDVSSYEVDWGKLPDINKDNFETMFTFTNKENQ